MRITALAGLFAFVAILAANSSSSVSAASLDILKTNTTQPTTLAASSALDPFILLANEQKTVQQSEPQKPEPKVYEVQANDTLSTIAAQYQTTWVRLFNKNTQIANPDVVQAGDKLTIPLADEQLVDRPLPEPQVVISAVTPQTSTTIASSGRTSVVATSRGSSSGNTYTPGYCTWYAKNRRPDLPNNLGNADTWVARAAAQGIPTGTAPRVGAIGQQGMHVVYVERINADGTVTISEMNYQGLFTISSRTVPASTFSYIY
jgi:surface antigen